MSALTSLLVRDQVVPVRKIEEAIQRQVVSGGELEDVLLDMGAVSENVMSAYRAAIFGLLPATREEVMKAPRETVRAVPREVAEQYRLVPLHAEGRTLVVAVSTPLSPAVDEQLSFLLGHDLVYRIVTDVRLSAALGHHYAVDVPARVRRIAEKLRQADPGNVPYVAPPDDAKVGRAASIPTKNADIDWGEEDDGGAEPKGRSTQKFGVPRERPTPRAIPAASAERRAADKVPSSAPPPPEMVASGAPAGAFGAAGGHVSGKTEPAPPPDHVPDVAVPRDPRSPSAGAKGSTRPGPPRRRVGPMTAKEAVEGLAVAADRDEILEVVFVFARQFFDYSVLFVVHDDVAEGREAYGSGPSREVIAQIAVPLDVPGTFASVRKNLESHVVDLDAGELDRLVARDMKRDGCQPAIVVPITVRGRAVLILYGDQGGRPFGVADVPELIALLPRVGDAFERIIRAKKAQGYAAGTGAGRADLKASLNRLSDVPMSPVPADAAGYRGVEVVPGVPAVAPGPRGAPAEAEQGEASAVPGARRDRGRKRSAPLDVLGVPRSAPPPPMSAAALEGSRWKETRPDGQAAVASAARQRTPEPARPVEPAGLEDPADEDFPESEEVTIDYDDAEAPFGRPAPVDRPPVSTDRAAPPEDSSYRLREQPADVLRPSSRPRQPPVEGRRAQGAERPTPRGGGRHSQRPRDPRRDDDSTSRTHDVVQVPSVVAGEELAKAQVRTAEQAPARRGSVTGELPSVIVDMGDAVEQLVDELVRCGPDDEGAAVSSLLASGEAALPSLVQRFPGPLWFDRRTPHRRLPRGRDISAIARAFVAFGERSVPYVMGLLAARDENVRFYAVLLSSEFPHPDLIRPLADRVFDSDAGTRVLVLDVLRQHQVFSKEMEEMVKTLRVEARVARRDKERRIIAVRALGELRDVKSVELLIELLASEDESLKETARRSLSTITRQDLGDVPRKWAQWAERNLGRHRIEWLIDALTHADDPVRASAGEELKVLTREYFGFHPAAPRKEREIVQRKYRQWWDAEGRARFS